MPPKAARWRFSQRAEGAFPRRVRAWHREWCNFYDECGVDQLRRGKQRWRLHHTDTNNDANGDLHRKFHCKRCRYLKDNSTEARCAVADTCGRKPGLTSCRTKDSCYAVKFQAKTRTVEHNLQFQENGPPAENRKPFYFQSEFGCGGWI